MFWSRLAASTCMAVLAVAGTSCDSQSTPLVSDTDDVAADVGRAALIEAVVKLSASPESPEAFLAFSKRLDEIMPFFSRDLRRDAELRICVLAIGPLQAHLDKPQARQMELLGATVWPAVLQIPAKEKETATAYVRRLCENELAIQCQNLVPEYWPVILNARVWRTLKSRIEVAYDRCSWCADDPDFDKVLEAGRVSHLQVETLAKDAQSLGRTSSWPTAGPNASPKTSNVALSFNSRGWVTIQNERPKDGDWRALLADTRKAGDSVGIHLAPKDSVERLLQAMTDVRAAGYEEMRLATRVREFPYPSMEYSLVTGAVGFEALGVSLTDTVQVLVQALDFQASKKAAPTKK